MEDFILWDNIYNFKLEILNFRFFRNTKIDSSRKLCGLNFYLVKLYHKIILKFMRQIKTALLAYGGSGKLFHAPFLEVNDGFELIGAYERSKKNIQTDYPNVKSFNSLEEVLESDAELIVVNTPIDTHFEFTKKVLEAGKHALVEKAFTTTSDEAEELHKLAKEKNLKLCVYQNRRYDSDFRTVKKVLEETAGKKKDLERRHIEDLLTLVENGTGKRISLPYNIVAEKNYQYIKVQKGNISDKQEMTGKILCEEVTDLTNIVENDCIKIIDYDRIETGVQLRCRKPGDFFTFGKDQKRKSLSRYFIDEKIPRQLREEIPLVADGSHIVWIVGRRISEYYKIKESTKRYLKLEFKREGDDSNGEYQSNDFRGRCKQTNRGDGSADQ